MIIGIIQEIEGVSKGQIQSFSHVHVYDLGPIVQYFVWYHAMMIDQCIYGSQLAITDADTDRGYSEV
jgi:hypothetical protein